MSLFKKDPSEVARQELKDKAIAMLPNWIEQASVHAMEKSLEEDRANYSLNLFKFGSFLNVMVKRDTLKLDVKQPKQLSFCINLAKTDLIILNNGKGITSEGAIDVRARLVKDNEEPVPIAPIDDGKLYQEFPFGKRFTITGGTGNTATQHPLPAPSGFHYEIEPHFPNDNKIRKLAKLPPDIVDEALQATRMALYRLGSSGNGGSIIFREGYEPCPWYNDLFILYSKPIVAAPPVDDNIEFRGTGTVLYVPYGLGSATHAQIMDAIAGD